METLSFKQNMNNKAPWVKPRGFLLSQKILNYGQSEPPLLGRPMKYLVSLFLFLSFVGTVPQQAHAGRVDILPRKLVLDDRTRSADITILNLGDKTGTLRISLLSYKQDEKGAYQLLDVPLNPAFDPEKVVRFSPKQFTLPPNGRQKIRLSIQRPADLPDGEYRFHVKAVSYDSEAEAEGKPVPTKGSSLALKMNLAVAIPVVVHKGKLTSTAKLENVSLLAPSQNEFNKPALKFDVTRTGTAGVMGTAQVFSDGAGGPKQIGISSNLNVFSESPKRTVTIPLTEMPQGAGNIRVRYTNDFGDKGVFDEIILQR